MNTKITRTRTIEKLINNNNNNKKERNSETQNQKKKQSLHGTKLSKT